MYWKNRIGIIVIILSIFACNQKENSNKLSIIKEEILKLKKNPNIFSKILILSENGCPGCSKSFYSLITEEAINKKNVLIYSTSIGSKSDFSELYEDSVKNHVLGSSTILRKLGLHDESTYIELSKQKIDTIISFNAKNLENSITYIKTKLNSQ